MEAALLLDIPPLDPKLPASIEAKVAALCLVLRANRTSAQRPEAPAGRDRRLLRGSGLLSLAVPAQFGGKGASWGTTFDIIRRLAKADSALAERLACQYLQLGTIQLLATQEQQGDLMFGTAHGDWLWGSAVHASSGSVRAAVVAGGLEVNGMPVASVCAEDADRLLFSAQMGDASGTVMMAVDADRIGILHQAERLTAVGATEELPGVEFRRLMVAREEVLGGVPAVLTPRATLRPLLEQLSLIHLFLGVTQGALEALVQSSRGAPRTRLASSAPVNEVTPFHLQRYADLWVDLKAALALTRSASRTFEDAWIEGAALTAEERAGLALEVGEARLLASRAGSQLTQATFEAMGNAGHASPHGFDLWWRRLRAHSLNDPVDFKRREIGRWLLTGDLPRASLFS
jgi:alkylation response protein AidB-like acyl-CoA dehydrogenase